MAAAVVTDIVDELLQGLHRNVLGVQWGFERKLGKIFDLISSIRPKLKGVENECGRNLELLDWLGNFKDVIFDAEDFIAKFSVEAALWQVRNGDARVRGWDKLVLGLKLHRKFRALLKRLAVVTAKDPFEFVWAVPTESIGEGGILPEFRLIGRKSEREKIIACLLEARTVPPVLTVVGQAGIGKTALIRDVYMDKTVVSHFDFKVWINASPPFNEKRMARDIVARLQKHALEDEDTMIREQLLHQLRRLVDGRKKYLYVLDDLSVEDPRAWLRFRRILLGGATGSKVLLKQQNDVLLSRIKRCFGFCSLFPRGHMIDKQTLVALWIALGCDSFKSRQWIPAKT
ncbi:hypothetical protein MLD38_036080 [Melastoma candidum]|uniref:Uncharacterized protein n=1 Tax=Melastoma candidum TaxID=119954 RepID=A0ACB9LJA6_9MYRT|nr:hypothetical protein MLD38_036080 [Melastoma candidum]